MFDSQTKLSNEVVGDLKSFIAEAAGKNLPWSNARIFASRIRRNIKLAESPSFGQTILQYDSASHGQRRIIGRWLAKCWRCARPAVAVEPASDEQAGNQGGEEESPKEIQKTNQAPK